MTDLDTDTRSDLDLDAIEAALADPCLWAAPWTAHTFEIDCPCPGGSSCGSMHTCVEVEAREEYPHGAPGEPAEEGDGQCVVQISVPGLETFARPTAEAIALLRNHGPTLVARLRRAERIEAAACAYVDGGHHESCCGYHECSCGLMELLAALDAKEESDG